MPRKVTRSSTVPIQAGSFMRRLHPNFLKWVLNFHIHNMTSLPTVEEIKLVMFANKTNPVVAYYMIREHLGYEDAVRYYQEHNYKLTFEQDNELRMRKHRQKATVEATVLRTGLTPDEVRLLMTIPYDGHWINYPADGEAKRMYPDSPWADERFMYGWSEEEARASQLKDMLLLKEHVRYENAKAAIDQMFSKKQ